MLPLNQILLGDAIERLRLLPSESIHACITSPPYFEQCDYQHSDQYGLEGTIDAYLDRMALVFAEVYRTLKNGACCWIIIGDTMNNYSPVRAKGQRRKLGEYHHRRPMQAGYREKEALGIPFKLIDRLRSMGYLHRQTLIWDKGTSGAMANSDTAGLTHEYILQFGKFNKSGRAYLHCKPLKSSVIKAFPDSDLIHPCPYPITIASTLVERSSEEGETILDPFMGSGTTALAALSLGRSFVGIELNPEYRDIALRRLEQAF